jgi:hypothetical protein
MDSPKRKRTATGLKRGETILKLTFESSWSFDPKETYRIIRTEKNGYFGQYTRNRECFDKDSPIKRCETALADDTVDALFDYMHDMQIPSFTQPLLVCDGAYYELTVGDYDSKSVFRWFAGLPDEHPWMPLQRLAEQIMECIPSEPRPPVACPRCHATHIIPILYGLPTVETFEQAQRGELILGGCCHEKDDPDRHCKDCGHQWLMQATPLFPQKLLSNLSIPVEFIGTPPDGFDPFRDRIVPPERMQVNGYVTFYRPSKNRLQMNFVPEIMRWGRTEQIYQVEKNHSKGGYVLRQVASGGIHLIAVHALRRIRGHGLTVEPSEAYGFLIGWPEKREILAALPVGRTHVYHERSDLFADVVSAFPQARELAEVRGLAVMGLYCAARDRDLYEISQRIPVFFSEDCLLIVPAYGTSWDADIVTRPAPPHGRLSAPWLFSHRRIESAALNPRRIHSEWVKRFGPMDYNRCKNPDDDTKQEKPARNQREGDWFTSSRLPIAPENVLTEWQWIPEAIEKSSIVRIVYAGGSAPDTERFIRPLSLFRVEGYASAYLQAVDTVIGEERIFRLDRIDSASPVPTAAK